MSSDYQPDSFTTVRHAQKKAVETFPKHRAVFEEVADRLFERLPLLAIEPNRILDLGSRDGFQHKRLLHLYPEAEIIGIDPAAEKFTSERARWRKFWPVRPRSPFVQVQSDPHRLPIMDESIDLVVSNLQLPWCHSPHIVFAEVARVLTPSGAVFFSTAGPDTLIEYRQRWAQVDRYAHSFGLIDMHDLGDAMLQQGLSAPVLDRETITVSYPTVTALEKELRAVAAVNLASGRRRGLMSPSVRRRLRQNLADAPINVTLELVQGHAWKKPMVNAQRSTKDGVYVPVDSIRNRLRSLQNNR
ncbi:MAG: methyltransferase domain-containing protein [Gammaproteobacteria bacterium]|nr:methyltransferase domain-containing protein [Gammaproteobacteria bacterium]